ncbi:MAG: hypothetical protein R2715_23105 [Ilumatobacteraceae bacterium]
MTDRLLRPTPGQKRSAGWRCAVTPHRRPVALLAPPPGWPLDPVVASSTHGPSRPPCSAWVCVAAIVAGAPGFLTKVATHHGADRVAVAECVQILVGSVPEIVDTIEERRDRWGLSLVVVPAAKAEEFGPVVERLAGG